MLDQYFSDVRMQEHVKETIREIVEKRHNGKLIFCRGGPASGKKTFCRALANALMKVEGREGHREEYWKPREDRRKLMLLKTNETSPMESSVSPLNPNPDDEWFTCSVWGFIKETHCFLFDRMLAKSEKRADEIDEELEAYLLSFMT